MTKPNSSSNHAVPGTVRRKADFLPTVFVSAEFDDMFIPRLARCFEVIITRAHEKGDRAWKAQVETFSKHGLFDLKVPQELILNPIEFEFTRPNGEKHTVKYNSDKPLSYGFEHVVLELDRARISDEKYLTEASAIFAYLFAWRLFVKPLEPQNIVLYRIDATSMYEYMHNHHRGEVSVDSITRFLLGRMIQEQVDELPYFKVIDRIGERISARLEAGLSLIMPAIEETVNKRVAEAHDQIRSVGVADSTNEVAAVSNAATREEPGSSK